MEPLILVWLLLLAAPIAALLLQTLARRLPQRAYVVTVVASAVFLGAIVAAAMAGIRFVPVLANIWMLATAYAAYAFLVFSIGRLPWPAMARYSALVVASLPIAHGYFMGSVGLLALMFVAGEYVDPPRQTFRLSQNTTCVLTEGGGLDTAYTLRLHHEWPQAPWLHRQIDTAMVGEGRESQIAADCAELRDRSL